MAIETLLPEDNGWRNLNNSNLEPYRASDDGYVPGWGYPTWEDHFEGVSLDESTWNVRNGYQDAQDASTMRPANVIVQDSHVTIRTLRQNDNGRQYTSGYFDSIGKWSRRYGRFEAKVITPTYPNKSRGIWPAVWLRDNAGGGEADIMEAIGSPNNHPSMWPASPGRHSHALYRQTGVQQSGQWWHSGECTDFDTADGNWHVYAFEWTPTSFTYYHDGVAVPTANFEGINPGFPSEVNWRIDQFVGSNWQGWPNENDTETPADFIIDYLRYWEYQP